MRVLSIFYRSNFNQRYRNTQYLCKITKFMLLSLTFRFLIFSVFIGNLKAHTWRKHKLTLLGTTTTDRGMVQTSITGPPQGNEEVINGSVVDNINTNPGVLETPVLEWP